MTLRRFLDDPRLPLDNGDAERCIRPVVLGRKVFHGARSEAGTRVAAVLYSLIESCSLEGVDAIDYLEEATKRALDDRTQVFPPEDYAAELHNSGG
jgi:transposase